MFPESLLQNSIFDALYCEEERFDEDSSGGFVLKAPEIKDFAGIHGKPSTFLFEHFWVDEQLVSLLSKEKKQAQLSLDEIKSDCSLENVRDDAIKWILKVTAHYGFTAATAVLAVNYYDRFISSIFFQKDKPWMSQLAAVTCISIAAKVEETLVPLLVDLQVGDSKFLFEAKTIQRMELLVLSTLQWKINPVIPISYFDLIVRKLGLISNLHLDILGRCESLILSIITDYRLLNYLPSVIASATMLFVIRDIDPCKAVELQNQFVNELEISKEKMDECLQLMIEVTYDQGRKRCHKRKHEPVPGSPSCVVDPYFSSDSSNDSWVVSSSPEPLSKRSRGHEDQLTRLASQNSICWHC